MTDPLELIEMTTDVVAAYVAKNAIAAGDLTTLIERVHGSLAAAYAGSDVAPAPAQEPAVNPKKSIQRDYLICLEDGRHFKSLKRHLRSKYDMSPEEYRAKWGLPADYPMVAPSYRDRRSALARTMGLGKRTGDAAE